MLNKLKEKLKNEDGAVMVLTAVIIYALILLVALAVNLAFIYINKQEAQGVADAASRAAVVAGGKEGSINSSNELILDPDAADKAADHIIKLSNEKKTVTNADDVFVTYDDHNEGHKTDNYNHGIYNIKVSVTRTNPLQLFDTNTFTFKQNSTAEGIVHN